MIISLANQKGGVGKTTIAINLAHALAFRQPNNFNVLFIDADPQASATEWLEQREQFCYFSMVGMPHKKIHKEIDKLKTSFDLIVIDCPPRVSDITRSAIICSDLVVIPVTPSPYDLWASEDVLQLVDEARIYNDNLTAVFLINMKIPNTTMGKEFSEELKTLNVPKFHTEIVRRVVYPFSVTKGLTLFELDSSPAKLAQAELNDLVMEVLECTS